MKVREPVARPLDVVAVEMLLSASQAFLTGVMMYLAVGIWADRGVAVGPVAIILGLLALAIAGGWLYWLLGGAGWLMAAANVPTAMFLGFALILGGQPDSLIQLDPLPLVLASAAALYGIVAGVFLDSPRRWRWDQRKQLRPGTAVPRVSTTTQAVAARMPRSLPKRGGVTRGPAGPATVATVSSIETDKSPAIDVVSSYGRETVDEVDHDRSATSLDAFEQDAQAAQAAELGPEAASTLPAARTFSPRVEPIDPATRSAGTKARPPSSDKARATTSGEAIELPTSVEPKAQRSPWAWAAPPEWTRDEDDGQSSGSRTGKT